MEKVKKWALSIVFSYFTWGIPCKAKNNGFTNISIQKGQVTISAREYDCVSLKQHNSKTRADFFMK